jgi:hemerythrin
MMEKIVWNKEFSTGEPEIDSQHKRIINQINYLIDNLDREDRANLNEEIIRNLDNYSNEHFTTEEGLLRKLNYPGLDYQIKEHNAFKLKNVKSAVKILKGFDNIPEETIQFLKDWWTNHILKIDMEYKDFISKR